MYPVSECFFTRDFSYFMFLCRLNGKVRAAFADMQCLWHRHDVRLPLKRRVQNATAVFFIIVVIFGLFSLMVTDFFLPSTDDIYGALLKAGWVIE